jgi:hypothetical protein
MRYAGQFFCNDDCVFTISNLRLTVAESFFLLQGTGAYDGASLTLEARLDRRRHQEFQAAKVRYPSDGWEPTVALRVLSLNELGGDGPCELELEWLENGETWLLYGELEQVVS